MTSASALVPLWDRAAEWARRLAMIREAQSFVYLSTYYIEHDRYGVEMLATLLAAQQRGVAVHLLIDGFGQRLGGVLMSHDENAALAVALQALRQSGSVVTIYRPARRLQRRLGGGQHVKIQVSEAGEAIFGSSNITRSSFEGWNEYSVALRGPIVAVLLASVGQIGGTVAESDMERLRDRAGTRPTDIALDYWLCNPNAQQGLLGPLWWQGPNVVTGRLIEMVDAARESLVITSFYFKPVEPLMAAVLRAASRGVQVEVHHSHRAALPSTDLAWIAAAASYGRLLRAGVTVYENLHGEHSKIVLVDRSWTAVGTYNFEHAAHDRLAEAMLASRDPRAVEPSAAIVDGLRRHPDNVRVTPESLSRLPAGLKARRAVFGRFKRWM